MEQVKVTTPEYLSSDILEEGFINSLLVHYRIQYILGSGRFYLKDRFVTPLTKRQKAYTIFCVLLAISVVLSLVCNFRVNNDKLSMYVYLTYCSTLLLTITCVGSLINACFFNCTKNVEFLVKMQKIDRLLKIERLGLTDKIVRIVILIPNCVIIIVGILLILFVFSQEGLLLLLYLGPMYLILTIMVELTSKSGILVFFVLRIIYINGLMENHLEQKKLTKVTPSIRSYKYWMRYYAQDNGYYYENSDTNIYLREIFLCFLMFNNLYRFQIFIFCAYSVLSFIISFGVVLHSIPNRDDIFRREITKFSVQTITDTVLGITMTYRYEFFFGELKRMKRLCISVMAKHTEGPLREKARNMLKMLDETPPRFSVYEMWELNAVTFIAMLSLTTSIIVTILQFVFL